VISSGQAIFLKRGEYCTSEELDGEGLYEGVGLYFGDFFFNEFIKIFDQVNKHLKNIEAKERFYQYKSSPILKRAISLLLPYFENEKSIDSFKNQVHKILFSLFESDLEGGFQNFLASIYKSEQIKLQKLLDTHCFKPYTVEELAEICGYKNDEFEINFKQEFGESPQQHIMRKRLDRAKYLLNNSTVSVADVCFDVGFDDVSYFISVFKKLFGLPPKRYQVSAQN
jgi:AraC-like DNA-binding protein